MSIHSETRKYEVVVVGGGLAGVCAAIASARKGARTAIIQNRSMFGGNASSEIRMHIVGANSHGAKKNLGETGILLEILLANKRRNPYASFPVFDSVIWEKVHFQENLESFLNTNMDDVILEGKKIKAVVCHQNSTETEYTIYGDIFVDATGHGTLATMCGATGRMGSEGRDEFKEPDAPEEPNSQQCAVWVPLSGHSGRCGPWRAGKICVSGMGKPLHGGRFEIPGTCEQYCLPYGRR